MKHNKFGADLFIFIWIIFSISIAICCIFTKEGLYNCEDHHTTIYQEGNRTITEDIGSGMPVECGIR
jgi:hypothetical protein